MTYPSNNCGRFDDRLIEIDINFISAIVIFIAAVIPVYIAIKLNNKNSRSSSNPNLKKLAIVLAIFIVAHGIYHIIGFFGFTLLAEALFEPLSIVILIAFGLLFYHSTSWRKEQQEKAKA